ncbi:hypothetical protein PAMA_008877 [Pampus argenteus]
MILCRLSRRLKDISVTKDIKDKAGATTEHETQAREKESSTNQQGMATPPYWKIDSTTSLKEKDDHTLNQQSNQQQLKQQSVHK